MISLKLTGFKLEIKLKIQSIPAGTGFVSTEMSIATTLSFSVSMDIQRFNRTT